MALSRHQRGELGVASTEPHAIVILFARDVSERERCRAEGTTVAREELKLGQVERRAVFRPGNQVL